MSGSQLNRESWSQLHCSHLQTRPTLASSSKVLVARPNLDFVRSFRMQWEEREPTPVDYLYFLGVFMDHSRPHVSSFKYYPAFPVWMHL